MAADDPSPNSVIVINGSRIVIRTADAARLILWIAENQADLARKGSWLIDHAPGRICVTRTVKETIA